MAYTKTTWTEEIALTSTRLNNLETQYTEAISQGEVLRADSNRKINLEVVTALPTAGTSGRMVYYNEAAYFDTGTAWRKLIVTPKVYAGSGNKLVAGTPNGTGLTENWNTTVVGTITDIKVDPDGNIYLITIAGSSVDRGLYKFNSSGVLQWSKTDFETVSNGVAVDRSGNVFVEGEISGQITKYNSAGTLQWRFNMSDRSNCNGMVSDEDGYVYRCYGRVIVVDSAGNRVVRTTDGGINYYTGIAVDKENEVIAVVIPDDAETGDCVVRYFTWNEAKDSAPRWPSWYKISSSISPSAGIQDLCYDNDGNLVVGVGGELHKIAPYKTLLWQNTTTGQIFKVKTDINRLIYTAERDNAVRCYDPDDGSLLWEETSLFTDEVQAIAVDFGYISVWPEESY